MAMSPVEKAIFGVVVPLVEQELQGPIASWLAANMKSASPQIQAAEKDLAPFIVKCLSDVLSTL